MSLLDTIRPQRPPEPKYARIVSFGTMDSRPQYAVMVVERAKETQRKHWIANPRGKR